MIMNNQDYLRVLIDLTRKPKLFTRINMKLWLQNITERSWQAWLIKLILIKNNLLLRKVSKRQRLLINHMNRLSLITQVLAQVLVRKKHHKIWLILEWLLFKVEFHYSEKIL